MAKFTEEQLANNGIGVNPDGTTYRLDDDQPCVDWSIEQLSAYFRRVDGQCQQFGKRESVLRFYQGQAVHIAHQKCRDRREKWTVLCKRFFNNRMTPNRVERLYLAAHKLWGEDAARHVSQHTITDLYVQFGIMMPKPEPRSERHGDRGQNKGKQNAQNHQASSPEEEQSATDQAIGDEQGNVSASTDANGDSDEQHDASIRDQEDRDGRETSAGNGSDDQSSNEGEADEIFGEADDADNAQPQVIIPISTADYEAKMIPKWEEVIAEAENQNGGERKAKKSQRQYTVTVMSSDNSALEWVNTRFPSPRTYKHKNLVTVQSDVLIDEIDRLFTDIGLFLKHNPPKDWRLSVKI